MNILKKYHEKYKEMKALEKEVHELAEHIKKVMGKDAEMVSGEYLAKTHVQHHMYFALKEALEKIDNRILKPFINEKDVIYLKVKKAG